MEEPAALRFLENVETARGRGADVAALRPGGAPERPVGGLTLALAAACLLAAGCSQEPAAPRLVLVFAPCTVNRHYLQPYDGSVEFTPRLAEFARGAITFERHNSEAGHSGIAYASLFTGVQAPYHGVFTHPAKLADRVVTLAEIFRDAGFETWYWAGHAMASAGLNYAQGVDALHVRGRGLDGDDPKFLALLDGLRADPRSRAFVITAFPAAHAPYRQIPVANFCRRYPLRCGGESMPKRLERRYRANYNQLTFNPDGLAGELALTPEDLRVMARVLERRYRANIQALDRRFGKVLDAIESRGLLDQSVVVFTSDHGERLDRENAIYRFSHGWELAPEVIGIPLLIRAPGARVVPGTYAGVTRSIDVLPTVAALAGIGGWEERDRDLRGVDLSAVLRGEEERPRLQALSHTTAVRGPFRDYLMRFDRWTRYHSGAVDGDVWVALRDDDRLLRVQDRGGGRWLASVFDLTSDPFATGEGMTTDRFDDRGFDDGAALERLNRYRAVLREGWANQAGTVDPHELEALRGLGYVE